MGILDRAKAAGARQVLSYIEKDPETNILKIIDWMIRFNVAGSKHNEDLLTIRAHLEDRNGSWYRLVSSLWTDVDLAVRKTIFENLIINVGMERQNAKKKSGGSVPMGIMLDQKGEKKLRKLPASEGGSPDKYDALIRKNKKGSVFAYIFTGGSASISIRDLRKLARIHPDCIFVTMNDPRDVDDMFADICFAAKNIVPIVARRGSSDDSESVFKDACSALRKRKLAYGAFAVCSGDNAEWLSGADFASEMEDCGVKLAWIFEDDGYDMPENEGREFYEKIMYNRNNYPLLIVDFIHEEQFLGGRITGW